MNTPHASTENTTPRPMTAFIPDTVSYRLHLIQMKREALDAEHQDLMASEDWLCNMLPHPPGAEYKGDGSWLHSAGGIFAISQELEPGVGVFQFLATSRVGGGVFKTLDEAVAWLDGIRDGIRDRAKA